MKKLNEIRASDFVHVRLEVEEITALEHMRRKRIALLSLERVKQQKWGRMKSCAVEIKAVK